MVNRIIATIFMLQFTAAGFLLAAMISAVRP